MSAAATARSIRREDTGPAGRPLGRSTVVPSKTPNAGSMPCMATSTAWTSCGGHGRA